MDGNLAYADEPRTELIGGKIVAMSPHPTYNHNQIAGHIYAIFVAYLKGKTCTAISDNLSLFLEEGKEEYCPDVMVVCDPSKRKENGIHGAPDLVVDVLSPSTSKRDRTHKKDVYAQHGVKEYWIVSPRECSIEQYILEDGQLNLHEIYTYYSERELEKMREKERAEVVTHFKCTLFDDLDIDLADIFYDLLPSGPWAED